MANKAFIIIDPHVNVSVMDMYLTYQYWLAGDAGFQSSGYNNVAISSASTADTVRTSIINSVRGTLGQPSLAVEFILDSKGLL